MSMFPDTAKRQPVLANATPKTTSQVFALREGMVARLFKSPMTVSMGIYLNQKQIPTSQQVTQLAV